MAAGWFFFVSLLIFFLLMGFSYIVWILALKEANWIKTTGIVIACGIAILVLIMFVYSTTYGGMMGRGMYGRHMMWRGSEKDMGEYMEQWMQGPKGRECIKKYLDENKK